MGLPAGHRLAVADGVLVSRELLGPRGESVGFCQRGRPASGVRCWPENRFKHYAELGIPAYWIIDPLAERVTFTQFLLDPDGLYQRRLRTDELVTLDEPWEITLDLPAWTRRRDRVQEKAQRRH